MDRARIDDAITRLYAARCENVLDNCDQFFAADAVFCHAGDSAASAFPAKANTPAERQRLLNQSIATWEWRDFKEVSRLIDGDAASVRYELTARHNETGAMLTVEMVDQLRFNSDYLLMELTEFADTAAIATVLG